MKQAVGVRCPHCSEVVPVAGDWSNRLNDAAFRKCENPRCQVEFELTKISKRYCSNYCRNRASYYRKRAERIQDLVA